MGVPRTVLGALGVGVLVAGTWFTAPTLAQNDGGQSETDAPTREQLREEMREEMRERRDERRAEFLDALAGELDVSVGELESALETVREQFRAGARERLVERLRQKVETGDLTEEEARDILDRFERGERPFRHPLGHRRGHRGSGPGLGDGQFPSESGNFTDAPPSATTV